MTRRATASFASLVLLCVALAGAPTALRAADASPGEAAPANNTPPVGDSIYALPVPLERSDGQRMPLAGFRGRPLLLAMFYSQCSSACPVLVERLRVSVGRLAPEERRRLTILLVSLDPGRDTPAALEEFAGRHHIGDDGWVLARASAHDTRALATVLGIRFRALPDGTITHSAPIVLLDAAGSIIARTTELQSDDAAFEAALRAALRP